MFDTNGGDLVEPFMVGGSDCPVGAVLSPGDSVYWHSNSEWQGNGGNGLPESRDGLGGGWQICFA